MRWQDTCTARTDQRRHSVRSRPSQLGPFLGILFGRNAARMSSGH